MSDTISKEQAEAAALWWGLTLVNPKFDAGADSPAMVFATVMAGDAAKAGKAKWPADAIQVFQANLIEAIVGQPARLWLRCDYDPCQILHDAAVSAGIDPGPATFPWKTSMWFEDGKVTVSYGYRAPIETIFPQA